MTRKTIVLVSKHNGKNIITLCYYVLYSEKFSRSKSFVDGPLTTVSWFNFEDWVVPPTVTMLHDKRSSKVQLSYLDTNP